MFICSVCGMQISDKSNFSKHKKSHSDVFDYECQVCCKKFKANRYLKTHKILCLEQEGERQHAEMNSLEDKNKKTMQKGVRYWQMLRDKENKMYASM